jgi:hypothetical protein
MPVLATWTILRFSTVGRRPSTSILLDNDILLTFSQLPLLQVRIPRSIESFCARKHALKKYPSSTLKIIKSAQLRHHTTTSHCATLSGYYIPRTTTNHNSTGTSPTPSRASTEVSLSMLMLSPHLQQWLLISWQP